MDQAEQIILIHYGELGLKGNNQPAFRRRLRENIRKRLDMAGIHWPIQETSGFYTIPIPRGTDEQSLAVACEALRQVFGIAWFAPAIRFPHQNFTGEFEVEDFDRLYRHLLPMANRLYTPGKKFAVWVKRPNKSIPFTSPAFATRVGDEIYEKTPWKEVDLKNPDVAFQLELHKQTACLFSERFTGAGGLPVGMAGRTLALLSGGIDSPVAAYMMAKRACRIDFIHFTASFVQKEDLPKDKVWRLAKRLNEFTLGSRLFVVPYTYFDLALMQGQVDYEVVLFRRFMVRVACELGRRLKCQALITGDNLSQVASQTLSNLAATARVAEMPLFQPLLGFDKEEIIQIAERIGTLQDSLQPYKDCCALISRHPRTSSRHYELNELEKQLFPDYPELIKKTLADVVEINFEMLSDK
jgi:thiamine biosynthesis protein ThiI